jgi:hypothetical protein
LVVKVQENSKGQHAVKTHEGTVLGAVPCQRHYRTFVQLSQEKKQLAEVYLRRLIDFTLLFVLLYYYFRLKEENP